MTVSRVMVMRCGSSVTGCGSVASRGRLASRRCQSGRSAYHWLGAAARAAKHLVAAHGRAFHPVARRQPARHAGALAG